MNKHFKLAILFILPVCLIFLALLLRSSKGPYFLNVHYDPGYAYLINSLNFAQFSGYGTEFIDHPGIPLQVFGGFVIKFFHLIQNGKSDITGDVLENPEYYMDLINSSIIFLNSFALLLFGWFIFKLYNNLILAVFFQLTPFSSFNTFYEISDVSAENFLLMFYILFILISIKYFYNLKNNISCNDILYLTGFSLLSGIGIATKLNFAPFILIPFLLFKKYSYKISYLISSFILFLIFISPGFRDLSFFLGWLRKILFNNGLYSLGNTSVNPSPDFILNLKNIFSEDIFFAIIYFFILILLVGQITRNFIRSKNRFADIKGFYNNNKLLIAVFLIINLEFLFLLKNFSHHYIFPSLVLTITALYFSIQLVRNEYPNLYRNFSLQSIYVIIMILIVSFQIFNYKVHFDKYIFERNESEELNSFVINKYSDALNILGYGSSDKKYALNYSTYWAGSQRARYKQLLYSQYPDQLFYEYWTEKIFAFSESADLKTILHSKNKIIFQTNSNNSIEGVVKDLENHYGLKIEDYKKIFENSNAELVYEINISKQ